MQFYFYDRKQNGLLFGNVDYSTNYSIRITILYCTVFIEFVKVSDFDKYPKHKSELYIRILK